MEELMDTQQALMEQYGLGGADFLSEEDLVKVIESIETGQEPHVVMSSLRHDKPFMEKEKQHVKHDFVKGSHYNNKENKDSQAKLGLSLDNMNGKNVDDDSDNEYEEDDDFMDDTSNTQPQHPHRSSTRVPRERVERMSPAGAFRVSGIDPSTAGTITGGSTVMHHHANEESPPNITAELVTDLSLVGEGLREEIRQEIMDQVRREMHGTNMAMACKKRLLRAKAYRKGRKDGTRSGVKDATENPVVGGPAPRSQAPPPATTSSPVGSPTKTDEPSATTTTTSPPSKAPTPAPTSAIPVPTLSPTRDPTNSPTYRPPTREPTDSPTSQPRTEDPTSSPTTTPPPPPTFAPTPPPTTTPPPTLPPPVEYSHESTWSGTVTGHSGVCDRCNIDWLCDSESESSARNEVENEAQSTYGASASCSTDSRSLVEGPSCTNRDCWNCVFGCECSADCEGRCRYEFTCVFSR